VGGGAFGGGQSGERKGGNRIISRKRDLFRKHLRFRKKGSRDSGQGKIPRFFSCLRKGDHRAGHEEKGNYNVNFAIKRKSVSVLPRRSLKIRGKHKRNDFRGGDARRVTAPIGDKRAP